MRKVKLEELSKMDLIALKFGTNHIQAIVLGNNGTHITWYNINWSKSSAEIFSYQKMQESMWTHIGKYEDYFLFKKFIYL